MLSMRRQLAGTVSVMSRRYTDDDDGDGGDGSADARRRSPFTSVGCTPVPADNTKH